MRHQAWQMVKINFKKIVQYLVLSIFFAVLSFITRYLALLKIKSGTSINNPVFSLTYVKNTGAAFSLFQNHTDYLITLAIAIVSVILFYVITNSYKLPNFKIIALSVVTAGILGNLSERIQDGYVTDYIRLNFINFPVFNTFDILITVGAVLLIIVLYQNK